jgi:DNA-binding response OmpR family regulator
MYKILLVEDDSALASAIEKTLSDYGNEIQSVKDFRSVTEEFLLYKPQLVLLDIKLPFYNGFHWCSELRKISKVPIIFLSSASDNMNIVTAISLGADDFIAKPVDSMVLNAKVQAVLRRTYEINGAADGGLVFHGAILKPAEACVFYEGKKIELTKNELRILMFLIDNKGRIVSRDDLMKALWQNDIYVEENTLTVNVGRLRKKLEENGLADVIVTKSGIGYMLV